MKLERSLHAWGGSLEDGIEIGNVSHQFVSKYFKSAWCCPKMRIALGTRGGPDYVLVDIPYAFRIGYPSDSIRQESQSLLNSPSAVADLPTVQAIDIPR